MTGTIVVSETHLHPLDIVPISMPNTVDFFISYTQADRSWAEWIAWTLEKAGKTTRIQAWDFRPGSNFVDAMQTAAADAERTIAVLSASYLQSRFTKPEWYAAFAQDPTGEKGVLLPVRVGECELEGLLPQIVYVDLVGLDREQARTSLINGIKRERAKPESEPAFPASVSPNTDEPRFPGALPPIWNVEQQRNRNFTGRANELAQLEAALTNGGSFAVTQALSGLGGIGKTQLALEYAYRYQDSYERVWWLPCEEPATLASTYASLAQALDLPEKDAADEEVIIRAVRRWLEQHGKWLLVFDNAKHPDDVRPYLPRSSSGHILITSRYRHWENVATRVQLDIWPEADAVLYIRERTGESDEQSAKRLAAELGYLPLALAQATGYIGTGPHFSVTDYLEAFKTRQAELWEEEKSPTDYEATIATTWNLAVERLTPTSEKLLRLFAFLAPDDIPWELLKDGQDELPDELSEVVSDPLRRKRAVDELSDYSLVSTTDVGISVHRMLQSVVRHQLSDSERNESSGLAVSVVNRAFPYEQNDPGTWAASGQQLPHAIASAEHGADVDPETAVRLLNEASGYLRMRGRYSEARSLLQKAIAIEEEAYEADHPTLAISYSNLATVENDLGNLTEARSLLQQAIAIEEQAYEADHPNLAVSYSNLAMVEQALGNLNDARKLLQQAIAIDQQAYEPNHPSLAVRYSNLALVEQALGNLTEARSLLQQAIAIGEQAYEPNHPSLAVSYSNLATVEQDLGNLTEARSLLQQAIAIGEQAYEPDHPSLAVRYSNLATVEQGLGNLNDARSLLQQAIAIDQQAYEPNHPSVAVRYSNLAMVEKDLGNLNEARSLLQQTIVIKEQAYEPDHPSLAVSYSNLALVEKDLGNLTEARSLLQQALAIEEQAYEADHPTLAVSYWNLAAVELADGNREQGRSLLAKAYEIAIRKLGPEHPTTKGISERLSRTSDKP